MEVHGPVQDPEWSALRPWCRRSSSPKKDSVGVGGEKREGTWILERVHDQSSVIRQKEGRTAAPTSKGAQRRAYFDDKDYFVGSIMMVVDSADL